MLEPGRVWIMGTPWPVVLFYLDHLTASRVDAKLLVHLRLGHICDNYIAAMDMEDMDLGVSSEELHDSEVPRCSEQCMPCQVAKLTRPLQTTDRGRVPEHMRKSVRTRQKLVRFGLLTFTYHAGPFLASTGGYTGYTIHVDDYSGLAHIFSGNRSWSMLTHCLSIAN